MTVFNTLPIGESDKLRQIEGCNCRHCKDGNWTTEWENWTDCNACKQHVEHLGKVAKEKEGMNDTKKWQIKNTNYQFFGHAERFMGSQRVVELDPSSGTYVRVLPINDVEEVFDVPVDATAIQYDYMGTPHIRYRKGKEDLWVYPGERGGGNTRTYAQLRERSGFSNFKFLREC